MSEDKEPLEIVVEFGTVHQPIYLRGFQTQAVLAQLDRNNTPYTLSTLYHWGDGHSRIYPRQEETP